MKPIIFFQFFIWLGGFSMTTPRKNARKCINSFLRFAVTFVFKNPFVLYCQKHKKPTKNWRHFFQFFLLYYCHINRQKLSLMLRSKGNPYISYSADTIDKVIIFVPKIYKKKEKNEITVTRALLFNLHFFRNFRLNQVKSLLELNYNI